MLIVSPIRYSLRKGGPGAEKEKAMPWKPEVVLHLILIFSMVMSISHMHIF